MEITFTTPALLFPAISLVLLAYSTRFLALAALVRELYKEYQSGEKKDDKLLGQIHNLRIRLRMVRNMQWLGVLSFLCCFLTMFFIYLGHHTWVKIFFTISLIALLFSLVISLLEITHSTRALELQLSDIEEPSRLQFITDLLPKRDDHPEIKD